MRHIGCPPFPGLTAGAGSPWLVSQAERHLTGQGRRKEHLSKQRGTGPSLDPQKRGVVTRAVKYASSLGHSLEEGRRGERRGQGEKGESWSREWGGRRRRRCRLARPAGLQVPGESGRSQDIPQSHGQGLPADSKAFGQRFFKVLPWTRPCLSSTAGRDMWPPLFMWKALSVDQGCHLGWAFQAGQIRRWAGRALLSSPRVGVLPSRCSSGLRSPLASSH